MSYRVFYRPNAKKDLAAIPDPYQTRIREHINELADDPRPLGFKKLVSMGNVHRIRVGQYRVCYEIVDRTLIVTVIAIAERGSIYPIMKRRLRK